MVIVLDKHKRPMGLTTPRRARILLTKKRAVVHKVYPFTIRVKDVDSRDFEQQKEYQLKIDPGSKHTGLAVVEKDTNKVVLLAQIEHRGDVVKSKLETRSATRRNRRQRETRYRRCKWIDHYLKKGSKYKAETPRPDGWLPPSVKSVADNIVNWIIKLSRLINITKISLENVRFDTQLMADPNIEGVEYQHGTLFGYEMKEYLLSKYGHTCQYCGGASGDPVLEWEHMVSKRNGGTDKVSNAALACDTCNDDKGHLNLDQWLSELKSIPKSSALDQTRIECISRFLEGKPIVGKNYAAWVNSYRKYLMHQAFILAPEVELASGGRTKYNREVVLRLPKDHHFDALCVGEVPAEGFVNLDQPVLYIKAQGRGSRFRGNTNKCGIITTKYKNNQKMKFGFQTGDIVKADVPTGKYLGRYVGRVAVRSSGSFKLQTNGSAFDVNHKYCKLLQRSDGYSYSLNRTSPAH